MKSLARVFALLLAAALPAPLPAGSAPALRFVDAFPGVVFWRPLAAIQPPDGTPRMFVVEQDGRIRIVDYPAPAPPALAAARTFLDLSPKVSRLGNEEGLLGLAFHPDFEENGRFFVHYSAKYGSPAGRRNVLSEMAVDPGDPDRADPDSERVILEVPQPYENHNGGWIAFGPDGMLYVALGDGGSGGDPQGNGQDLGTLLGKLLRIDVDGAQPYGVPADNPFVARAGALPEIWAYGLRNPWRCSFDRATGDLWAADVGQDAWEEVDRVVAGGNYGWDRREGFADFEPSGVPPADPLIDPLAVYDHSVGQSITGGYVYRGSAIPSLAGAYVFGDFVSGTVRALRKNAGVIGPPQSAADVTQEVLFNSGENIASFAEDRDGEILACSFGGRVLALVADAGPAPPGPFPALLSQAGLFADFPGLVPADGALPYGVRAPLWSDGARKDRFLLLPEGTSMEYRDEDAFDLPEGAFAVKTFSLGEKRIETRVIRRTATGFDAATYRWAGDLSDATLVEDRQGIEVLGQAWTLPSPADCRQCHTDAAGFLLGVRARQIEAVKGRRDLLAAWHRDGVLAGDLPPRGSRPVNLPIEGRGRRARRVRSWLDANCASCHRPGAPLGGGSLDLRAATPLEDTGMIDGVPQHGDLGVEDARLVAPGDPARSLLLLRSRLRGPGQMPLYWTHRADDGATAKIEAWIRGR